MTSCEMASSSSSSRDTAPCECRGTIDTSPFAMPVTGPYRRYHARNSPRPGRLQTKRTEADAEPSRRELGQVVGVRDSGPKITR